MIVFWRLLEINQQSYYEATRGNFQFSRPFAAPLREFGRVLQFAVASASASL